MQHVSYGPLIMSIMLIMSCYTGFFNVRRGWQSLNTGPRFYLRLIRRTGWLWIFTSRTTNGRPFKPKKLSVPFLYPGVRVEVKYMERVQWNKKNVLKLSLNISVFCGWNLERNKRIIILNQVYPWLNDRLFLNSYCFLNCYRNYN